MGLGDACPLAVPLVLAGELYQARGLRVRDLASFEQMAARALPSPLRGLDAEASDYRARLRAAYDRARAWPPSWGSEPVREWLLGTAEGAAALLVAVLRDSGVGAREALDLAGALSAEEWASVHAVAWGRGADPWGEINRRIDRAAGLPEFDPKRDDEEGVPWSEAVARFVLASKLPLAEVLDMELRTFDWLGRSGKDPERFDPLPADPELELRVMDAREGFWAERIASGEPAGSDAGRHSP